MSTFVHFGEPLVWKGKEVVAIVIVMNYVIGGFNQVHLIWLADVTVQLQVSDYSQLSDYIVWLKPWLMHQ